jgi:hypothetical protein
VETVVDRSLPSRMDLLSSSFVRRRYGKASSTPTVIKLITVRMKSNQGRRVSLDGPADKTIRSMRSTRVGIVNLPVLGFVSKYSSQTQSRRGTGSVPNERLQMQGMEYRDSQEKEGQCPIRLSKG